MKILLAYQSGLPHRSDPYISLVPTGLCYLHACLREAGYDSILANFSAWPTFRIKQELLTFKPDFVGISQWTHNRHVSLKLVVTAQSRSPPLEKILITWITFRCRRVTLTGLSALILNCNLNSSSQPVAAHPPVISAVHQIFGEEGFASVHRTRLLKRFSIFVTNMA